MLDTILVSLAVTAGLAGLAGVPVRCWQFAARRFYPRIPQHALARATFRFFAFLILVPSALAWAYALHTAYRYLTCVDSCSPAGVAATIAIGLLGCAYFLLEGFLLTARRRITPVTSDR